MKLIITLPPDEYRCLKRHIPKRSTAYAAVRDATELVGFKDGPLVQYRIECGENDLTILLKSAQKYCSPVVSKIQELIHESRKTEPSISFPSPSSVSDVDPAGPDRITSLSRQKQP